MRIPKPSKKQLLTAAIPAVVIIAAFAYVSLVYLKVDNNSPEAQKYKQAAPTVTVAPQQAADDSVTPAAILKDPTKYANKDVKIRGRLMEFDKKYQIVNEDTSNPVALPLDVSKTKDDLSKLIYGTSLGSSPSSVQGTVVVIGKLTQETVKDRTTLNVVVTSVK